MTQVPILPPPWGPALDSHFDAKLRWEGYGCHRQATPDEATMKGWFYRPEWYSKLIPDTRRCIVHGEQMYDDDLATFPLDPVNDLYRFQEQGMATGYLAPGLTPKSEPFSAAFTEAFQ